jgi:5-methylcytosine-specific restriction endonuclease McrA
MIQEQRQRRPPSVQSIRKYWEQRKDQPVFSRYGRDYYFRTDWTQAETACWCCGESDPEATLERAHIVSFALGGSDEPSNFVLLCTGCHLDSPDVTDPRAMWDWILTDSKHYEDILDVIFLTMKPTLSSLNLEITQDLIDDYLNQSGIRFIGHGGYNGRKVSIGTTLTLIKTFRDQLERQYWKREKSLYPAQAFQ